MLAILLALNLDAVRALKTIDVSYHGTRHMLHQSRRPAGPLDVEPWSGRTFVDLRRNRLLAESHATFPRNMDFAFRWVLEGDNGFAFDLKRNNQGTEAVALPGKAAISTRWSFVRNLPPLVLLYAADHGVALDKDVVEIEQPDGTKATLRFDPATHLLRSLEQKQDEPILGDGAWVIAFSKYRDFGGVMFPTHRVESSNGIVVREVDSDIVIDTDPPEALFTLPVGYTMPRADAPPPEEIRKLADGVWTDTARSNALIVEMADYVVAIEAPNNPATAQLTIDAIHRTVPNKPIRYLAITHAHSDHAGGTAAYANAGATILTTPANAAWVRSLAHLKSTPTVETIKSSRTLGDATHTIELFAMKTSHVDEQLFAWLPKERILFQADLFFAAATGPIGPQFPHAMRELRAALASRGIKDIAYVIDPDGKVATGQEFAAAK